MWIGGQGHRKRKDYSRVDSHEVVRQRSDHLVVLKRCELHYHCKTVPVVSDVKRKYYYAQKQGSKTKKYRISKIPRRRVGGAVRLDNMMRRRWRILERVVLTIVSTSVCYNQCLEEDFTLIGCFWGAGRGSIISCKGWHGVCRFKVNLSAL